jgi:hypothetical protein
MGNTINREKTSVAISNITAEDERMAGFSGRLFYQGELYPTIVSDK